MNHSTSSSNRAAKREWRHNEKILPAAGSTAMGVTVTEKEHKFIKLYEANPNAGQCAMDAFDCANMGSARTLGSKLVKKFGLKKSPRVLTPSKEAETDIEQGKISEELGDPQLEKLVLMYRNGGIPFERLYARIANIALHHADAMRAVQAAELVKQWNDEREAEHRAREMQDADIVDLLSNALSHIPREKYIEVLKVNRAIRKGIIAERNKDIDIDAIVKKEQAAFLKRSRGEE